MLQEPDRMMCLHTTLTPSSPPWLQDGHTPISFAQLRDWESCRQWKGFEVGQLFSGSWSKQRTGMKGLRMALNAP